MREQREQQEQPNAAQQQPDASLHPAVDVTPEELVNDYLIGAYEVEKLRHGFRVPFMPGEPCDAHRDAAAKAEWS